MNKPAASPVTNTASRRLELAEVVSWLVQDKLISPEAGVIAVSDGAAKRRIEMHPLAQVAEHALKDLRRPGRTLGVESLSELALKELQNC